MHYLIEKYHKTCSMLTVQYGFKRKGKAYVRVVNDVMQNFMIERINQGRECRIQFAVLPLCMRIEKDYISGGVYSHSLRRFEPITSDSDYNMDSWSYDSNSTTSMDKCIHQIARFIVIYLLPFFERANSSQTALDELIELDKLFDKTRLIGLKICGIEDMSESISNPLYPWHNRYCMALKQGLYDLAWDCHRLILEQNLDSYSTMLKYGMSDENKKWREDEIAKLNAESAHFESS